MTCGYFSRQKTLSNEFNYMKMAAEIKLASALNKHQVRQLYCVNRDDVVLD